MKHDHALKIADLTVSYRRIPALHHIAFEVHCGQCVGLIGPNGAGKTTLLKTLAGLVGRETGTIHFHGREVTAATPDIAYLPQRGQIDWDFPTTVRGLVEMGRYLRLGWWRRYGAADAAAVDAAVSAMSLEPLQDRQISALSGGQQQRAFLARALAQEAHVFLLDEPFAGLDKPNQDNLRATFRGPQEAGKAPARLASRSRDSAGDFRPSRAAQRRTHRRRARGGGVHRGKHPEGLLDARLRGGRSRARGMKRP